MDPLIKLLEDDEDDNGPTVSGAAVDAFAERLKGELSGAAAAAAYGLTRAGNGSLRSITSLNPAQAPATSSVPPATGRQPPANSSVSATTGPSATASTGALTVAQAQWQSLTPLQQQQYMKRLTLQRQQQQQQQQQQHQQQQQLPQQQAISQASKRAGNISHGISFGALMPLLQPHLPTNQAQQLSSLYQRFKQSEITREDFVRGARVIAGDQVLVQTIRQMHMKQQQLAGTQQPNVMTSSQQQTASQQSGSSNQPTGSQQSGSSGQPVPSSAPPSTQVSPSKLVPDHASISKAVQLPAEQPSALPSSGQNPQALSLQQQQQQQQHEQPQSSSQQPSPQIQSQQVKADVQSQGTSQSSQSKPPLATHPQGLTQQTRSVEQTHQAGEVSNEGVARVSSAMLLQQVKHEVDKSLGTLQLARPSQTPVVGPFQPRPPTLATPHTVGGQPHPALSSQPQVPRVAASTQFGSMQPQVQLVQPKLGYPPVASEPAQQPDKPLTKYGRAKLRKEIKKQEEEERIRKLQEEDKLRRLQQSGGPITSMGSQPPATQSAQPLSMPTLPTPQPHPKLLENKQQVAQPLMAIKQEPQPDPNAAGLQKTQSLQPAAKGQDLHTGQVGNKAPGHIQLPESASLPTIPVSKDPSGHSLFGEQSHSTQSSSGLPRYPSLATPASLHAPMTTHPPFGSSVPQATAAMRQAAQQPHVGAPSPRVAVPVGLNSASALGPGGASTPTLSGPSGLPGHTQGSMQMQGSGGGSSAQSANVGVKTPQKKPPVIGQKKPAEPMAQTSQPASKKQKVQGADADQSIDQLNDVTAVSGVNLREEEEQLLAGPKEESRTTEAMRKFVQEEEEKLFLERGPLRIKVQAAATKSGLRGVNEDVERCLSMSAEERLRSMLYKLIKISKQRCDAEKDMHKCLVTSDPRRQVLLMRKQAKEVMEKKQAEENERLRKLNEKKDKGSLVDTENEDLRLKAQKAQQEEEDKMRANAANVAARAAVGADDMLSKWQMMAAQGLAKRQGGDTAHDGARTSTTEESPAARGDQDRGPENGEPASALGPGRPDADGEGPSAPALAGRPPGPGPGAGRGATGGRRPGTAQGGRQPRTINLKDAMALLERDPFMAKSTLLYRLYQRDRSTSSEASRRI